MELGSQQECPFGIFLCVFCLTKKGSVCALIVKRVFVIIEWLVGEKENIWRKRVYSVFSLCSAPTYHCYQIISAGVTAAAEIAKEVLVGGSSSNRSDSGKLEGERDEKDSDKGEKK